MFNMATDSIHIFFHCEKDLFCFSTSNKQPHMDDWTLTSYGYDIKGQWRTVDPDTGQKQFYVYSTGEFNRAKQNIQGILLGQGLKEVPNPCVDYQG